MQKKYISVAQPPPFSFYVIVLNVVYKQLASFQRKAKLNFRF